MFKFTVITAVLSVASLRAMPQGGNPPPAIDPNATPGYYNLNDVDYPTPLSGGTSSGGTVTLPSPLPAGDVTTCGGLINNTVGARAGAWSSSTKTCQPYILPLIVPLPNQPFNPTLDNPIIVVGGVATQVDYLISATVARSQLKSDFDANPSTRNTFSAGCNALYRPPKSLYIECKTFVNKTGSVLLLRKGNITLQPFIK